MADAQKHGAEMFVLRHFILHKKPNIYQDRLGTNVGKVEKETVSAGLRLNAKLLPTDE